VSIPSIGLFKNQPKEYQNEVIPPQLPAFGLTAGLPSTLQNVVNGGTVFGLDHFGASAPYKILDEKFGFSPQNIASEIQKTLKKRKK
ncbi:MAG: transketolase, partial [Muribaculaceae bacterium]|nr:transketolase [Muribaculaceae bacterium]